MLEETPETCVRSTLDWQALDSGPSLYFKIDGTKFECWSNLVHVFTWLDQPQEQPSSQVPHPVQGNNVSTSGRSFIAGILLHSFDRLSTKGRQEVWWARELLTEPTRHIHIAPILDQAHQWWATREDRKKKEKKNTSMWPHYLSSHISLVEWAWQKWLQLKLALPLSSPWHDIDWPSTNIAVNKILSLAK